MQSDSKSLVESSTFWSTMVGFLLFALKWAGVDTHTIDPTSLTTHLLDAAQTISYFAIIISRIASQKKIVSILPQKKDVAL